MDILKIDTTDDWWRRSYSDVWYVHNISEPFLPSWAHLWARRWRFGSVYTIKGRSLHVDRQFLVDKIIIAQDSLGRFINKIQPGAYKSLTKVDFKALDTGFLQPIGVYGSQESIVSFFLDFGIVDDEQ